MARYNPVLGPKTLQCVKQIKRAKEFRDPYTGATGRCGECRPCWRLFVWQCRQLGLEVPRPRVVAGAQRFANWVFMRAGTRRQTDQ